jgi:hypothetical protein
VADAAESSRRLVKLIPVALVAGRMLVATWSRRLASFHVLGGVAVSAFEAAALVTRNALGSALCIRMQLVRKSVAIGRDRLLTGRRLARLRSTAAGNQEEDERHASKEAS